MELELHEFQASILRELLFKPHARFRDLKKVDITNDHFTFHVQRLVKEGLVIKDASGYTLSDKGKEFANRLDTFSLEIEKQAKVAVALHAVRTTNGITEYLIHQRLKEPFYGWFGSHTGKIKWGETPLEAAKREFMEETGLEGKLELKGITNVKHIHKDGRFLEDKYFFVFKIENLNGDLKEVVEEGKNIWMTESEYRATKNTFATFDDMAKVLNSKKFGYVEYEWVVNSY
ncbi:NUDIX domain-containing protein [candidate division WWE3 bacterium]|nr:NUDIX domain-containing protein [candidate division WWE3 bacterium]